MQLPDDILYSIFQVLILYPDAIEVHYIPRKSTYSIVRNIMLVNKHWRDLATRIFYRQNHFYFPRPANDLPLFICQLRDDALFQIRHIQLDAIHDLLPGLRLLLCCKALESLEIISVFSFTQKYLGSIKDLRLKRLFINTIDCSEKLKARIEKTQSLVEGKTIVKSRWVKLSRQQIVS